MIDGILGLVGNLSNEIGHFWLGLDSARATGHLGILLLCLLLAYAFEFVNGFHDTANAVATVIYTKSLKPWPAVVWAGICNFLGVFVGGTVVAMAIIKLVPPDLIMASDVNTSMAFVFSLLMGAVIWNLGTWYFGIPASSSHTLIGSILGIGIAHSYMKTGSIVNGVNWAKAYDVGLALFVSPLIGFGLAALILIAIKKIFRNPTLHSPPKTGQPPPWHVRAALIFTSTGVSFAHGSNDGQKGVGLVMLILIALMPAQFALRPDAELTEIRETLAATERLPGLIDESYKASLALKENHQLSLNIKVIPEARAASLAQPADLGRVDKIKANLNSIREQIGHVNGTDQLEGRARFEIRNSIFSLDKNLGDLEKSKSPMIQTAQWSEIKKIRGKLLKLTDYAPTMVLLLIALSLGLGTMIGWKRIVVTIGEKIGKSHLTYAQGASAELVAMGTIGISAVLGLPVSTTHVLSSGIAGTMVANRSGVQSSTVNKILSAWVLTLPMSILLSASLYILIVKFLI